MYLKALEIQGFKSFADKTRLTFEKDITAIVGPNGSGKSNLSDAILWVMGEQRSKTLRGGKMEDVIFGGTEIRSAMGFAQVSLILDNSAQLFRSEGSELMLTRRFYRSGESEYYINREQVRLKDITNLLMDTGLGRDGYSIIGQGKIADIISTRGTDRREVFEEAAGISRYRYRKEEAERKLQKTEENLLRIKDKIEELELQVGPLKEQSETARRYLHLRDELRVLEISVWLTSLDRIREQADSIRREYSQLAAQLDQEKKELEAVYVSSDSISERMHRKDIELDEARDGLSAVESELSGCESEAAVLQANIVGSEENIRRILQDLEQQRSRIGEIRTEIDRGQARLKELDGEIGDLDRKQKEKQNMITGCALKLQGREAILRQLEEELGKANDERNKVEARIRVLDDMQRDYEGYSKAVKTIMRESERGTLQNIYGPVSKLLKTDREAALAIETALGAAGQHIVVGRQDDGRRAIELLQRQDAGRATFLPMDTIRGTRMNDLPEDDPGFVGIASDLVDYDSQYEQIVFSLLGKTLVAESLTDAIRIARKSGNRVRIVTLDGQMIHAGGSMTGGSNVRGSGLLSRASELDALKKTQTQMQKKCDRIQSQLEESKKSTEKIRYEEQLIREEMFSLQSEAAAKTAEYRSTEASTRQFSVLLAALDGDTEAQRTTVAAAERQKESLTERLTEKNKQRERLIQKVAECKQVITRISNERLELEGKRTRADKQAQQLNTEINDLERRVSRAEQRKLSSDLEEKQIIDKLWDNYELSHSEAETVRQPVANMQKANREVSELRKQINALGTPNLGAIEEYERVHTRYEFLTDQRNDVEKARQELLEIIRDVTHDMETVFVDRFREIDTCFRTTFRELFGGGKAALILEDENNVLESGIEIRVQPPGKAVSTISLLSGGEMAFVAIALYFAILKVRPTPFCVMDEIEAALDEENVSRFAAYLRQYSDKTQFIIITHRRGTMESADMLYGVTMQEKGVSTVLSLDLEEARKTAEG